MNKKQLYYFQCHPAVNTFYFTADGQAFLTTAAAAPHATNLQAQDKNNKALGVVTPVTRDEIMAWWITEAPKELATATDNKTKADAVEALALKAVNNLTSGDTPTKKLAINNALKAATADVEKANAALIAAQAAVDALPVTAAPETPAPVVTVEELQANLDNANKALADAVEAKAALPATASTSDKGKATQAVNKAKIAVDEAQMALDNAA